ncbi:MAG: cation-translocating P-type ATPase [Paracoccaceae bacterium]
MAATLRPGEHPASSGQPPLGLTEAEAQARLAAEGYNELPHDGYRSPFRVLIEVLSEPMLALLLAGGAIYLLFGDLQEALLLLAFASFSILVTTVQESRTERLLESLRDLTSPRALVLRGGTPRRIAGREVARGDLLLLAEGDRVAADGWLVSAADLMADESLLTGESFAVGKEPAAEPPPEGTRPGGDTGAMVYAGALIVRGQGTALVTATGAQSEIGKIGKSLTQMDPEPPRLRAQTLRVVRLMGIFGALAAAAAVVLYGLTRGDWLEAALAGIALGMALLPEEFPVVLTVFMAMGAWRISQARVLTRRAAAIESLGAATVLCTDKTGTLTQNRMTVSELDGHVAPFPGGSAAFARAATTGLMASAPAPFDPMDRAFHDLCASNGLGPEGLTLVRSFGLRPDLLAVTQVWRQADGAALAAAKGAPEAIALLCRMGPAERRLLDHQVGEMAAKGLRVLALARADLGGAPLPAGPEAIDFAFAGLAGLSDPLRAEVPQAIADAQRAGIRVVMITGDYPTTAQAIGQQAGLDGSGVLTGPEIAALSDADLTAALENRAIFARVMPDQKLRLVTALKTRGEIVAMTGDGVNDAPSLKAAHIGIAMGGRGTDVAREASSIVLLDDDFGAIVKAVRLGRRIYDNLRKAMGFVLSVHLPIAGLALVPLAMDLPLIFLPVHIAFLEMIIDPVCSLVFEAESEEPDVMQRPPRAPDAPLFSVPMLLWSVAQGLVALGAVLLVYFQALDGGLPPDELRALSFLSLVLVIVALIFVNRSFSASPLAAISRRNPALAWVPLLVGAALAVVLMVPAASELFSFGPVHAPDVGTALVAALAVFGGLEVVKLALRGALAR